MPQPVKHSDLQFGPVRHPTLPDDFVERVKAFKAMLADVDQSSLEHTLENFKRDTNPESELLIWERIANNFQLFLSTIPTADAATRKDILAVLLGASMGTESWGNIKHLKEDQITQLIHMYRGLSTLNS